MQAVSPLSPLSTDRRQVSPEQEINQILLSPNSIKERDKILGAPSELKTDRKRNAKSATGFRGSESALNATMGFQKHSNLFLNDAMDINPAIVNQNVPETQLEVHSQVHNNVGVLIDTPSSVNQQTMPPTGATALPGYI